MYGQFLIYVMVIYGYIRRRLLSPSSPSCRCLIPLDTVVFGISVREHSPSPPPSYPNEGEGREGKEARGHREFIYRLIFQKYYHIIVNKNFNVRAIQSCIVPALC